MLEKLSKPTDHPQAHFLHQSSMEVFRRLGLADKIYSAGPPVEDWARFVYCESMTGSAYAIREHFSGSSKFSVSQMMHASPCSAAHLAQSKLVKLLLDAVDKHPLIDVKFGHEVTHIKTESSKSQGNSTVVSIRSSDGQIFRMQPESLVGADGSSSTIRNFAGININRGKVLQNLVNVHFTVPAGVLDTNLNARGMLYFVFNPSVVCVIVAHDIDTGEYVCQIPFFPPYQNLSDFTAPVCKELILSAIGTQVGVDVKSVKAWTMQTGLADTYRTDNILIVGDACHQFPPAGAFGMNSGIQDANNLAWKLAGVLSGELAGTVMDTYETERRNYIKKTIDVSLKNFRSVLKTAACLGADSSHLDTVLKLLKAPPASFLPLSAQKKMLEQAMDLGRSQFYFLSEMNPIGSRRLEKSRSAVKNDGLALLFPGLDLGTAVTSSIVDSRINNLNEDVFDFVPAVASGVRLPHANIRIRIIRDNNTAVSQRMSTIDLVDMLQANQLMFLTWGTVSPGNLLGSQCWSSYLKHVHIARETGTGTPNSQSIVWDDAASTFSVQDGAALVRPDGIVAWCDTSLSDFKSQKEFNRILNTMYINKSQSCQ